MATHSNVITRTDTDRQTNRQTDKQDTMRTYLTTYAGGGGKMHVEVFLNLDEALCIIN